MQGAKKVANLSVPADNRLRERLRNVARTPKQAEKMDKDAHLLEAARASDGLIVSMDEEVRNLFDMASNRIAGLRRLTWVNPAVPEEEPIRWLKAGAPVEKARLVGMKRRGD